jgi:glycosyltransferase involved in cell wall biosynthesis
VSKPRISAVITTFNQSRFLREALTSALSQQDCAPEVILVDDGSEDATLEVAAPFAQQVQIIHQRHRGVAAARNTGWRSARADVIAFLDGDDVWLPEKLKWQLDALAAEPETGLVYSDTMRVRPDGSPIDRWGVHMRPVVGDSLLPMLRQNRVHTSTVLMRRAVLEELGGFDETLPGWEDIDLWTRTAARYPFGYVDRVLARYRMHAHGISHLAMDLADGRLTSTGRLLQDLHLSRVSLADRKWVMADIYLQKGMAYYLQSEMTAARRWLVRAWTTDTRSIARRHSVQTYAKSLAGARIIGALRSRVRPIKHKRESLRAARPA